MPMSIALDTSILRRSGKNFDTSWFRLLAYAISQGWISLNLPEVVYREYKSHLEHELDKNLRDAMSALVRVVKSDVEAVASNDLSDMVLEIQTKKADIIDAKLSAFDKWLDDLGANVISMNEENYQRAMDAYFLGAPPYRELKSRKDIPDSFIYEQILELQNSLAGNFHFVVEDGQLRTSAGDRGIRVWVSIEEFFTGSEAQEYLKQSVIKKNTNAVFAHVHENIASRIDSLKGIIQEELYDIGFVSGDGMPGESEEIYVNGAGDISHLSISSIEYLGATVFEASIDTEIEFQYEYPVPIYGAYDEKSNHKIYSITSLNDHYVNLETSDLFRLTAKLSVEFNDGVVKSSTLEELIGCLENPEVSLDEFTDFQIIDTVREE